MKNIVISENQNIIDVAMQEYGSLEGLLTFARLNGLALDEDLVSGTNLIVDEAEIVNKQLQSLFENRRVNTGTELIETGIFDDTYNDTFN